MAVEPPDDTVGMVENGPRTGGIPRKGTGTFKGGEWVGVKFEPTHWTVMEGMTGGRCEDRRGMPAQLRPLAARAKDRAQKRSAPPEIGVTADSKGWTYGNPYGADDEMNWLALLVDAFGTRAEAVAHTFINHLAQLCSSTWIEEDKAWRPNDYELQTAIAFVQSMKPKNEAQAALAAQAVALHFATMKVGKHIASSNYTDPRTLIALAKVSTAYAGNMETMHKLKGGKASRHNMKVSYEKHVHQHQHVHVEGGGGAQNGGHSHAPRQGGADEWRSSLPGSAEGGRVVLLPCGERQAGMPDARRTVGSAKR